MNIPGYGYFVGSHSGLWCQSVEAFGCIAGYRTFNLRGAASPAAGAVGRGEPFAGSRFQL